MDKSFKCGDLVKSTSDRSLFVPNSYFEDVHIKKEDFLIVMSDGKFMVEVLAGGHLGWLPKTGLEWA